MGNNNIINLNYKKPDSPRKTFMALINKILKYYDYIQTIKYISDNVFKMANDSRFILTYDS